MNIKQLCKYFNRKDITVRKAIRKMCDSSLEKYKIELTELCIEIGYPYNNFFIKIKKDVDNKTNV